MVFPFSLVRLREALNHFSQKSLREKADRLPAALYADLERLFRDMDEALKGSYIPPTFVHGDCHVHQFFVSETENGWRVNGAVDMEVASAGDSIEDLVKFSIEMMREFPNRPEWWDALMKGYGGEIDFHRFKLRLLGTEEAEFRWAAERRFTAPWDGILQHIFKANDWHDLFAAVHLTGPADD